MKHWDLIPGELVRLARGPDDHTTDSAAANVRFLFHTTRLACFETLDAAVPRLLQFEALEDGSLVEIPDKGFRKRWHVVGPDRDTRTVAREALGQKNGYTMTDRSVQRAIAKGTRG